MCYNYKAHSGMDFAHTSTKIAKTEKFGGGVKGFGELGGRVVRGLRE